MTDLIRRDDALTAVDPDNILPQWIVDYVRTQLREIPPVEAKQPKKRKRVNRNAPDGGGQDGSGGGVGWA